jgi:hypothetical protein
MSTQRLALIALGLLALSAQLPAQTSTAPSVAAPTGTLSVLVLLNTQPQYGIRSRIASSANGSSTLASRQEFASEAQAATSTDQSFIAAYLAALGATGVKRYTAVNAVRATLPALNLDTLATDPVIGHIWQFNSTGSNPVLDLIDAIDNAVTASSNTVLSASLPDGAAYPDDAFAQLIDRLIDAYQLTVVLQGGAGNQANAITAAGGAAAAADMQKPDFVTADASGALAAIGSLSKAGVTQPLAQKALLIDTADSSTGWSTGSGWGAIDVGAINAMANVASGAPVCVDQDQNPQSAPASCFIGSTAGAQYYETNSSSPVKLTLAWDRSFAGDGTPLPNNFELHVYDRSNNELASAVSDTGNVLQATAASDSGLVIKVVASNSSVDATPARFALASSRPMAASVCAVTVSPTSIVFPATQGPTESFTYTIPPGCSFLSLSDNGSPNPFAAGVYPNLSPDLNPGTYTFAMISTETNSSGKAYIEYLAFYAQGVQVSPTITLTQPSTGPTCTYSASSTSGLSLPYSGGSGGITITASPSTCASSISGSASWINFTGAVSGTGTWTANFTVSQPNIQLNASTTARSASLVVSAPASGSGTAFSQSFTVTQAGLQCTATLPSTPFSVPAAGIPQSSPQSFAVGLSNSACQWTATTGSPGLLYVVNDGVMQTGKTSYTVQYWAKPNPGTASALYMAVDGETEDGFYVANELKITKPAQGDQIVTGEQLVVTWTYSGAAKVTGKFELLFGGNVVPLANMPAAQPLDANPAQISVLIPATFAAKGSGYTVRITPSDKSTPVSSGVFTISNPTFTAMVTADDKFDPKGVVVLSPGDLTVMSGGAPAKEAKVEQGLDRLVVTNLDAGKTYTLTLKVTGYLISPLAGLTVSKYKLSAIFDAYSTALAPVAVTVNVLDSLKSPIPNALVTLTASDGSTVNGNTGANGSWSGYVKGKPPLKYTAAVSANGYTFKQNGQAVTPPTVNFMSDQFTGKVVLQLLAANNNATVSELASLYTGISIVLTPAASTPPTPQIHGNAITWDAALDPTKTYTVTFKNADANFSVTFPTGTITKDKSKLDLTAEFSKK